MVSLGFHIILQSHEAVHLCPLFRKIHTPAFIAFLPSGEKVVNLSMFLVGDRGGFLGLSLYR